MIDEHGNGNQPATFPHLYFFVEVATDADRLIIPTGNADRFTIHATREAVDVSVDGDADRLINRAATANTCTKKRLHDATIEQPHRYDEAVDGDACLQKVYGVIGCNILFTIAHNGRYKFMPGLRLYRGNCRPHFKSVRNKTTSK